MRRDGRAARGSGTITVVERHPALRRGGQGCAASARGSDGPPARPGFRRCGRRPRRHAATRPTTRSARRPRWQRSRHRTRRPTATHAGHACPSSTCCPPTHNASVIAPKPSRITPSDHPGARGDAGPGGGDRALCRERRTGRGRTAPSVKAWTVRSAPRRSPPPALPDRRCDPARPATACVRGGRTATSGTTTNGTTASHHPG